MKAAILATRLLLLYMLCATYLLLSGCATFPVNPKLPAYPSGLAADCGKATTLPKNSTWRDVLGAHSSDTETIRCYQINQDSFVKWIGNLYGK